MGFGGFWILFAIFCPPRALNLKKFCDMGTSVRSDYKFHQVRPEIFVSDQAGARLRHHRFSFCIRRPDRNSEILAVVGDEGPQDCDDDCDDDDEELELFVRGLLFRGKAV